MSKSAQGIVNKWGANATCWQVFNPGIAHWIMPQGNTLIGYRQFGTGSVIVGDPIGPPNELISALQQFESTVSRSVLFGASDTVSAQATRELGRVRLPIGFQTSVNPTDWESLKLSNAYSRYQMRRAYRKNVRVRLATLKDSNSINECLSAWQSTKGPFKLYFMTDPAIALAPDHRKLWIAEQNQIIQGYIVASPIPQKKGWLLEQWVRLPHAPNGTIEQLVDHAITELGNDGAQLITMGLCPLMESPQHPISWKHRTLFHAGRAATSWFYKPQSLTQFKLKFQFPEHELIYASFSNKRSIPGSILDTVYSFIKGPD